MATRVPYPIFKAFTADGTLGIGYKLYTYKAGTTTLLTTYQDEAATIPNTNPIILDSLGEAELFITEAAKLTLTDPDGAIVPGWPVDNIDPAVVSAVEVSYSPSGDLSSTNVQAAIDEIVVTMADFLTEEDVPSNILEMPTGLEMQGGIVGLDCYADTSEGADTEHDVSVALGACFDSTNVKTAKNTTVKVKRIDAAWAEGDTEGGLLDHATAAVAANTLYNFYALFRDTDGEMDFGWVANARSIADFLPAGYSHYRFLRFYKTNGDSNICGTTQNGDYITHHLTTDWVLSSGITTSYAAVTHTSFIVESRVELIEYGARDASVTSSDIYASDDGTNTSFRVGTTRATTSAKGPQAWGINRDGGLKPYLAGRSFRSESGTLDLLIQGIKLKR